MNKILTENLDSVERHVISKLATCALARRLLSHIEFSDSIDFNLYGDDPWIIAKDRADVEKALALAPVGKFWSKQSSDTIGPCILYKCEVLPGVIVNLFVQGDALPPTCKLVEEEVTIPAQPERKEMRRMLKCAGAEKQPEQVAPPIPPQEDEGGDEMDTRDEIPQHHTAEREAVQEARDIERYGVSP